MKWKRSKVCFISYKLINNEPSEKLLLKQPWFRTYGLRGGYLERFLLILNRCGIPTGAIL